MGGAENSGGQVSCRSSTINSLSSVVTFIPEIITERLTLRQWRNEDRDPFAALNADPRVRQFFPSLLTREESDQSIDRIQDHFARHGFGMWAVEVREDTPFIGYVGIVVASFQAHFTPCVEIGWRLAFDSWGHGFATEGARAVIRAGFDSFGLTEIVALTAVANLRSRRVMEKLGMTHDPNDDFDHPNIEVGHPLRRHVLYRVRPSIATGSADVH